MIIITFYFPDFTLKYDINLLNYPRKEGFKVYNKRFFLVLFCFLLALFFIGFRFFLSASSSKLTNNKVSVTNNSTKDEISLIEAYKLTLKDVQAWHKEAQLVIITSVDDDKKKLAGDTGKRKKWNLLFANIPTEETLQISISDGVITQSSINKEKL